ncbi:uncharacterized protein (TIRG00374 family) [Methanolinea mesophila]|uniref:lysylphosphatidylglycerol synthase transmembrane domain-containing protein n=1 Tax=Methanolinea mesophila TaxID=547055 RepID=UPI001AE839D1|nr:lysylphosphatidylglycerol synthase transmembrane domain-containing protein [Methanolinea mesophila]MBP1928315.1 uncharacterized protein (TIRG00374 family) [Methanolinea mesophila]
MQTLVTSMKKSQYIQIIAILLTITFAGILISQISINDLVSTLRNINPAYLLAGFLLYSCSYFFRSLRFGYLLDNAIRLRDMYRIVCLHNMFNYILPVRSGELTYVYLIKKIHGRTAGEGLATLIISRIFDYILITILFLISFFLLRDLKMISTNAIFLGIAFMLLLLVLLMWFMYKGRSSVHYLERFFGAFRVDQHRAGNFILRKCDETVQCIEHLKETKQGMWYPLIISTLGVWLSIYTMNFVLILAMNIQLTYIAVIFASTFAILTTVLPVQGMGNFGTLEAGWTLGFIAVGVSQDAAISSGFIYHFIVILYFAIWGVWGFLALRKNNLFTFSA